MKYLSLICLISFLGSCTTESFYLNPLTEPMAVDQHCPEGTISFVEDLKPLINAGCATSGCHDAQSAREGVILDTYENIMKKVTAYAPNQSELYTILNESGDDRMPVAPNPGFTPAQKKIVKDWIEQGAQKTLCQSNNCEIGGSSFSAHVYPMIQNKCIGCHNSNQQSGGINLSSYALVVAATQNSNLLNSIKRVSGFLAMPTSNSLSDCEIGQVEKWINEGMLNN